MEKFFNKVLYPKMFSFYAYPQMIYTTTCFRGSIKLYLISSTRSYVGEKGIRNKICIVNFNAALWNTRFKVSVFS
jgi:hypothetical protein